MLSLVPVPGPVTRPPLANFALFTVLIAEATFAAMVATVVAIAAILPGNGTLCDDAIPSAIATPLLMAIFARASTFEAAARLLSWSANCSAMLPRLDSASPMAIAAPMRAAFCSSAEAFAFSVIMFSISASAFARAVISAMIASVSSIMACSWAVSYSSCSRAISARWLARFSSMSFSVPSCCASASISCSYAISACSIFSDSSSSLPF